MKIPLEDNVRDIVGKAQRGLKMPAMDLPQDEEGICRLASKLHLGAEALVASAKKLWYPADPGPIAGLKCYNTPYEDYTVNSYIVFDPVTNNAAAFDTGSDCSGLLKSGVTIRQIFITHIHGDHIMALDPLAKQTGAAVYVSERETIAGAKPFKDGSVFFIDSLKVETRRTSGHALGGVTYVVTGLKKRIAIVGDAIFAGSMGGGMVSYEEALKTGRENILSLPDDTVICPGHGPLTSVGEEKRHNPFFTA
jgi:glyoxylase-like metal-dependent hydrolase (beta-lactamase superfamily II)